MHYQRQPPGDAYVVPHNQHLLMLRECHINVKYRVRSYLYKYIFTGPDCAYDHVGNSVDEIQDYLQAR